MKVITATAALEDKKVKLDDTFDVVQEINAGGRVIANANEEFCGGTFVESFAHSCNTVFAPLGVEIGEEKFVETAERFGFNQTPTLFDEEATEATDPAEPSIPQDPGDDVDLAASAIGQGQVLATALSMASVAQTIGAGGMRSPTPLVSDEDLQADAEPVEVTSRENARVVRSLMEQVVNDGTGTQADLGRIQVAGKTGTAELGPDPDAPPPKPVPPGEDPPKPKQILDAWFIAFAPSKKPKLALGIVLVDSDADGGEVAAPIAADILSAGL
jgi:cell division protein FtsI/penicillin-binding protein 2